MYRTLLAAFWALLFPAVMAQPTWLPETKGTIKPFVMLQLWSSYSTGQEVYNRETGQYEAVEDRFNTQIRRGRAGLRAQPYEQLKFTVVSHFDLIGRDALSATMGGYNPATPEVGIWDAFGQWQVRKGSEALWVTGGFFRPQLSRESITSGWSVNSMEKSMSQNYIRRHLVGTGPGRAMGLNLGGLLGPAEGPVSLNYNVGIFNPLTTSTPGTGYTGNSTGRRDAPLLVGRVVLYLGDPEQETYKIGYDINYFGQRRGLSIGLGGAHQGATDLFDQSQALSLDFLLNYGPLNVDGDVNLMWRQGRRPLDTGVRDFAYASQTGHLRAGVNLPVGRYILEPAFMVMQFRGGLTAEAQADAAAVGAFSGREATYDAGLNWYLNQKRLKLLLHYTWHTGDPGAAGAGAQVNQFFSQSGVGPIRRGDWLGLGMNIIF